MRHEAKRNPPSIVTAFPEQNNQVEPSKESVRQQELEGCGDEVIGCGGVPGSERKLRRPGGGASTISGATEKKDQAKMLYKASKGSYKCCSRKTWQSEWQSYEVAGMRSCIEAQRLNQWRGS